MPLHVLLILLDWDGVIAGGLGVVVGVVWLCACWDGRHDWIGTGAVKYNMCICVVD